MIPMKNFYTRLKQSIAKINPYEKIIESSKINIEDLLSNHLEHKEDIDQTLNQLFRHHIKICSNNIN